MAPWGALISSLNRWPLLLVSLECQNFSSSCSSTGKASLVYLLVNAEGQQVTENDTNSVCVSFAEPSRPMNKLRVHQNGEVKFSSSTKQRKGMAESFYLTELEEHSSSIVITHKRRTKNDKKGKSDQESSLDTFSFLCINPITSEFYLGRCAADEGGAKQVDHTESYSIFKIEVVKENPTFSVIGIDQEQLSLSDEKDGFAPSSSSSSSSSSPPYISRPRRDLDSLSIEEINTFKSNGYLQVSHLVPQYKIDACLRVLNHHLGLPGAIIPGGTQKGLGKFGGKLTTHPCVIDLLSDAVFRYVENFLGIGNVLESNLRPQIALRFPEIHEINYTNNRVWHTDPYRQGHYHNFSLIVGVFLSDVYHENAGNLCLWPGSHVKIFHSKDHSVNSTGDIDFNELCSLFDNSTLSESKTVHQNHIFADKQNLKRDGSLVPDIGPPVQLLANAGDVVFCHPDLAHCGGINTSSNIRSMVYFRIKSKMVQEDTKDGDNADTPFNRKFRHGLDKLYFDLPGII